MTWTRKDYEDAIALLLHDNGLRCGPAGPGSHQPTHRTWLMESPVPGWRGRFPRGQLFALCPSDGPTEGASVELGRWGGASSLQPITRSGSAGAFPRQQPAVCG